MKHPRLEGFGFVVKGTWIDKPPYLYCRDVNGGACPLFEAFTRGIDEKEKAGRQAQESDV